MTHEVLVGCQPCVGIERALWCGTGREPFVIDTKCARELADEYRTNHVGAECIRELADEVDRLRKELSSALRDEWVRDDAHMDLCREQVVELLEAKSKGVDHEDE